MPAMPARLEARHFLTADMNHQDVEIGPIDHEASCPFKYNTFAYRVTLHSPTSSARNTSDTPGCVGILAGTTDLIVRLTNADADGMSNKNPVENEVAIINTSPTLSLLYMGGAAPLPKAPKVCIYNS